MGTQGGGPPNKWNVLVATDGMYSNDFLNLLNDQADKGNTEVVVKRCTDGEFAFFGNYKNKKGS